MSKAKWQKLLVGGVAVYALGLLAFALIPPTPGVTCDNYYRIRVGMTQAEVESIFGGPADTPDTMNNHALNFMFF